MNRLLLIAGMIAAAAASRLLPHPPNFAPIGAIALLGGATFRDRRLAFAIPLAAMLLSDAVLGFHRVMPFVYGSFVAIVMLGFSLRDRRRVVPIAAASLLASTTFFVVTNFGVWMAGSFYPKSLEGLATCYVTAIPFFGNTLLGDAVYASVLFGGLAIAERVSPEFREPAIATT